MTKQNKIIIVGAIIVCLIVIVIAIAKNSGTKTLPGEYDKFAQCLADKGATMYGAVWCPHCQEQKAAFGDSFKYIKYVECPDNTKLCIDQGITGYPTWMIGTTTIAVGFDKNTTMQTLSEKTGCLLPQSN